MSQLPPAAALSASAGRRIVVGATCWVLTVLFFVGQAIAQAAVTTRYSLVANGVQWRADTGVIAAEAERPAGGTAQVADVVVMNSTFVVVGLLLVVGAVALRRAWPQRRLTTVATVLLALAGAGQLLAGLSPEDVNGGLHVLGALFGIPLPPIAILLLAASVGPVDRMAGVLSVTLGLAGVVGLALMIAAPGLLGAGASERLAAYPTYVWTIAIGSIVLARRASATAADQAVSDPGRQAKR